MPRLIVLSTSLEMLSVDILVRLNHLLAEKDSYPTDAEYKSKDLYLIKPSRQGSCGRSKPCNSAYSKSVSPQDTSGNSFTAKTLEQATNTAP